MIITTTVRMAEHHPPEEGRVHILRIILGEGLPREAGLKHPVHPMVVPLTYQKKRRQKGCQLDSASPVGVLIILAGIVQHRRW